MMKYIARFTALLIVALLVGCGGQGSSAPPPTITGIVAKDSRVVLTWNGDPGVSYWVFSAAASGVTPSNCSSLPLCSTARDVISPATVTGLTNGTGYSFSVNGRVNAGPGGTGSPAVDALPNMAGQYWDAGLTQGVNDLRGLAYGATGAQFIAAGLNGALYSGTLGVSNVGVGVITWTDLSGAGLNPLSGTSFNAVNYDSSRSRFYVAGAGGAIIMGAASTSTSTTWTQQTSNTANTINAIANNGAGLLVAVGAGGTILTSSDGQNWVARTIDTGNTHDLYGVTYGYDAAAATYRFVAVGTAGTILWGASDGTTWTDVTASSGTSNDLMSVTFGGYDATTTYSRFVAVGAGGTVVTSLDGLNWRSEASTSAIPSSTQLNAVTYYSSRRFMAVANDGKIYYSSYSIPSTGMVWTQATDSASGALNAIAIGANYDYLAVGAGGINYYADRAGN